MFWNNPLIEAKWPSNTDPIQQSMHDGAYCLFYDPNYSMLEKITTNQRLSQLCYWASSWIATQGIDNFATDPRNHYDIANLVKLNMWIHDIKQQGIVKPWLLLDRGNGWFEAGTGDSRLRCLERIPYIKEISAFISTTHERRDLYRDLEEVRTFDQFASICKVDPGTRFLFRLTGPQAPYGLYWYEYSSKLTESVTPGQDDAVEMFVNYYQENLSVEITPEWFDTLVPWASYKSNS
jgi:hypothetical protein